MQYTSPIPVASQYKLMSDEGYRNCHVSSYGLGKTTLLFTIMLFSDKGTCVNNLPRVTT